jgi:hypothetical protein
LLFIRFIAFLSPVRARGSELMSTATTIQAHTAYDVMDAHNPGSPIPDLRNVSRGLKSANGAVEAKAAAYHPQRSSTTRARFAALTLDDFGGRSDALGG